MDSIQAFINGELHRKKPRMVFDWDKAARIIRENNALDASAGLKDDWEWTGGKILKNGQIVTDSYTYLSSTWATPQLKYSGIIVDCFMMENEVPKSWGKNYSDIKLPESSIKILRGTL